MKRLNFSLSALFTLLLALATSGLFSSCSSGGKSAGGSESAAVSETVATGKKITLGIIPLTDCAPLVVAYEKGLFKKYGLDVQISKEASWANVRDKLLT